MTSQAQTHIDLLGKLVKCRVTGFQGVVCSVSFDLFGCIQAVVKPGIDKDGKLPDGHWFDINRLEILPDERRMPVPAFSEPAVFGATPQQHAHGPTEKPHR